MNTNLEALISPTPNDFFILDIDSTLVTTHQRNQKILEDWIQENSSQFPEDCLTLKQAQCQFGDYGLKNAKERVNFTEQNPGSQDSLDSFWRKNFFSNDYLHSDVAMRGAVNWTQNLEERGVEFVYLTARHKNSMWEGTLSSLDALGFPISEETLFLKEDLDDSDAGYKTKLMARFVEKFGHKKMWFVENEPVVLHQMISDHPSVNLVYFDSTHSGRMEPPEGLLSISDFCFSGEREQ